MWRPEGHSGPKGRFWLDVGGVSFLHPEGIFFTSMGHAGHAPRMGIWEGTGGGYFGREAPSPGREKALCRVFSQNELKILEVVKLVYLI